MAWVAGIRVNPAEGLAGDRFGRSTSGCVLSLAGGAGRRCLPAHPRPAKTAGMGAGVAAKCWGCGPSPPTSPLLSPLSRLAVTLKWPAQHLDRIQLYSLPTPNGVKVSIPLEELGLPYEAHRVSFDSQDQMSPEFLSISPNNKIPALLDPDGPGRTAAGLVRVGRDPGLPGGKSRPLHPGRRCGPLPGAAVADVPDGRHRADVWPARLFSQVCWQGLRGQTTPRPVRGGVQPVAGRARQALGRPRLDAGHNSYSIADIAIWPWVRNLVGFYGVGELVQIEKFTHVSGVLAEFVARPAVQRGLLVPPAPPAPSLT